MTFTKRQIKENVFFEHFDSSPFQAYLLHLIQSKEADSRGNLSLFFINNNIGQHPMDD